jgi:BirA family biotin operon repressor/biotin-[acetyl-CoA-carboxylase] ligase
MTAWAIAMALKDAGLEPVTVKWPNDILLKGKKVSGILTEMNLAGAAIHYIVVGVGLNVNTLEDRLPDEATSLKAITGRVFDTDDLSHIIMKRIDVGYALLCGGSFGKIIQKIKELSGLILGGRVRVSWENKAVEGYAVDFDEHGALVIRLDSGFLEKVTSGHLETI